ncbi:unnamed protein product, partial [Meganyctiphanes norvegica]
MASSRKTISPPSWKDQGYVPMRYVVTMMTFLATMLQYMMRLNINFGIVAMVKPLNNSISNNSTDDDPCGFGDLDEEDQEDYAGDFEWDQWTQGLILGSFFWGYIWTQVPVAQLLQKIRGCFYVCEILKLEADCPTLLPPCAYGPHVDLIGNLRFLLYKGAVYPASHVLLTQWAPPLERSWLTAIIHADTHFIFILPFLVDRMMFQASIFVLPWMGFGYIYSAETRFVHRNVMEAEKIYDIKYIGDSKHHKALRVPIKSILSSLPVWAIIVAGWGDSWGFYTLLTDLPIYMKNVLKKDIKSNALNSAMPYFGYVVYSLLVSNVGDRLRRNGIISTIVFRKVATALAHMVPAVMLLCLSLVECNQEVTLALFFIAVTFQGGATPGFTTNIMDIAPNYAGTVYGIENAVGAVPGFLVPMMVGAIVTNQQSTLQWREVFNIGGAMYLVDAIIYVVFASGQEQIWNRKYSSNLSDTNDNKQTDDKCVNEVTSVQKEVGVVNQVFSE